MKTWLTLSTLPALLGACAAPAGAPTDTAAYPREEILSVNAQRRDCMGVAPMKCLEVRRDDRGPWELFYGSIEGFDFVPGHEWRLRVHVERVAKPPADASALRYRLIEILGRKP